MSKIKILFLIFSFLSIASFHLAKCEKVPQEVEHVANDLIAQIDDALTQLENGFENIQNTTWDKINDFKLKAKVQVGKFRKYVKTSADKLEVSLCNFVGYNISETTCNLVGKFRNQAIKVFDNVKSCINKTIETGISRARNISDAGNDIKNVLRNNRKDVIACKNNVSNIAVTLNCISKVSNSTKQIKKKIPVVTMNFTELRSEMSSFPAKLRKCAVRGGRTIRSYYKNVISKFPECLRNKATNFLNNVTSTPPKPNVKIQNNIQLILQKIIPMKRHEKKYKI